jgi:hypothetical protein
MIPHEYVLLVLATGMVGVLIAAMRAVYYQQKLLAHIRTHHATLWDRITFFFIIDTTVNPVLFFRFLFTRNKYEDKELEYQRLVTGNSIILAFLSMPLVFIVGLVLFSLS